MILASLTSAWAQTTYKKRVLFFGPSLRDSVNGPEVTFINNHPLEFEPVDNNTPGKSAVWTEQQWIDAAVADFNQFDAIAISDTAGNGNHPALLASRAIWGSAINGNFFIVGGDPVSDAVDGVGPNLIRIFRQGLRFSSTQAGNAHGRTGLYIALDHMIVGQNLNGQIMPTEIPVLSWFGSFTAVNLQNNAPLISRLVTANPAFNVLGADLSGYNGNTVAQGFHSWPGPFVPIAQRIFNLNATPTNTIFYTAPCEADTGYQLCKGQGPLVYILAKVANLSELTRLVPAQCNVAVIVGQPCNFSAYSTIVPDPNPNNPSGPSTQVSWRVVTGPNAGKSGFCTRQMSPYGIPGGIWSASYVNTGNVTANNFQDVVQLFLDYPQNGIAPNHEFNDMSNSADVNDPNDPSPGMTIEYGTTFTVNWGAPQVSVVKLPTPVAAAEPSTSAFFRVSRTGSTAAPLNFTVCFAGTALPNCSTMTTFDYIVRINGIIYSVNPDFTFTTQIPQNLASVDVEIVPVDDFLTEGTETVRMALKDVFNGNYVVGGQGFAQLDLLDNDQPVVTVSAYISTGFEGGSGGAWIFDTGTAITEPLKVYFTLGGTATHEVDYLTTLIPVVDDNDPQEAILLPSGVGRVIILPTAGSPLGSGHHAAYVSLATFQDSRTEGTESATLTLLAHPAYKIGSPSAGSVNITDDDSPKIPANGYTITDLGDTYHTSSTAAGINNNLIPQVAGSYIPYGSPTYYYSAFRWSNGTYTDIAPLAGMPSQHYLVSRAINDSGLVVGSASSVVNGQWSSYYFLSDGGNTMQLQTPSWAPLNTGPRAINNAGWIVGEAMNTGFGVFRATRWDAASGIFFELSGLNPFLDTSSFAWALSSSATGNRVIGESQIFLNGVSATTTALHAFRTQPSTDPQPIAQSDDLGNSLASETSSSGSRAINSLSEIVGYSAFSATEQRASYKDGNSGKNKGWRSFGVLSGGSGVGVSSLALGLNDLGLTVGWSRSSTGYKAVVWENYQTPVATDLNLKIPVADRPNWVLQYATGINASGKIIGYGLKNGQQRAFLLTPVP